MTLEKPATAVIVNAVTGKIITCRSLKQLMGGNYHLLNRQRKQKQHLSHRRKNAQRHHQITQFNESELGKYIDRLLAKVLVELALLHRAGSIVLPELDNIREIVQSEVSARAEAKIPGCLEAQKKYVKKYRMYFHQWSYSRLKDSIQTQASQENIVIELVEQPILKTPVTMAVEMAIIAYKKRSVN